MDKIKLSENFVESLINIDNFKVELGNFDVFDPTLDIDIGLISSNIPIVNTVDSIAKIGLSLRERNFLNNIVKLLYKLNKNIEAERERDKILIKFKKNAKQRKKQTELMLLVIEGQNQNYKVDYFSNLLYNLLKDEIDIVKYELFVSIFNNLYFNDFKTFIDTNKTNMVNESIITFKEITYESSVFHRLEQHGLVTTRNQMGDHIVINTDITYRLTYLGKEFLDFILDY